MSYVMLQKESEVEKFIGRNHNAFILLSIIALRAKRQEHPLNQDRKIREAEIGDYKNYGMTRSVYRTAIRSLVRDQIIAIKTTNKGTIATLLKDDIYDINVSDDNQQDDQQVTIKSPSDDHQVTTNNKLISKEDKKKEKILCQAKEVIDYLNGKKGSKFRDPDFVVARLNDGWTVADCKKVIDNKLADKWFKDNPKYLCPKTLFCKTNFEGYLNEEHVAKKLEEEKHEPEEKREITVIL